LHVTSGSDYDDIGSRVFAFWHTDVNNTIFIGNPIGTTNLPFNLHECVTDTYSTYKIVTTPFEDDPTATVVELFIDDIYVTSGVSDKVQ
jgi:hypothetical protein